MRQQLLLSFLTIGSAITWAAGPVISDVVNYGSRIGSGLPGSGIAQGAVLAVTGAGLGPAQALQATFPLPTSDGLGGVTVTVTSGTSTANAIMVAVSATEVDAILPSSTPLGAATVTVSFGGATISKPITVVASAFGIFQGAGIYNVNADGSVSTNSTYQSAQPGQTIMINGTGLGAIPSDETQSGATDVPSATVAVWVGTQPATVVSSGRGSCCSGIDPNFRIPQGIAAWDVLTFTLPAGVTGCQVPIAVQSGGFVSNFITISVATNGGTCPQAMQFNGGNPVFVSGPIKVGLVNMTRVVTNLNVGAAAVNNISDSATAIFTAADVGPNQVPLPSYTNALKSEVGTCTVFASSFDRSVVLPTPPPSGQTPPPPLDAGPLLTITNAKFTQGMPNKNGVYSATTVTSSIQIAPTPPIVSGGPDFIVPGPYGLSNGGGGADIGPFKATLSNPAAVKWESTAQNATIDRSQGMTVKWSGGDPGGVLAITGFSTSTQGTVILVGSFYCYANISDGQFTVPSFITQPMPASGTGPGSGSMTLDAIVADLVTIPGVDVTYYFSQNSIGGPVVFQ